MKTQAKESSFVFIGNRLCLDFINTEVIVQGQHVSLIQSYADLRAWLLEAGVVEAASLDTLEASWNEEEKAQIVRQALELRATLRSLAEQITAGQAISAPIIDAINGWLKQWKSYRQLSHTAEGYSTTIRYEQNVAALLAPLAASAADLLVMEDLRRVRKCAGPQCILYFYDTSKNHARRWCSMDVCGNRSKVADHYRRSYPVPPTRKPRE